jgi:hypothetical protein
MAELNMETIVALVKAQGIAAYVEQTGGGVATIYAGDTRTEAGTEYYAVAAGPGRFSGPRWSEARGDDEDFCVGPDNDGSAPNDAYTACKGMDEAAIAAEIVRRATSL